MGMHAVKDVVVAVPEPILLLHCGEHFGRISLRFAALVAVDAGGEQFSDLLVALLRRHKAAAGEGLAAFGVNRLRGREEIDVGELVLLRDVLDRGGVEQQVGVLHIALWQIAFRALIFIRDGADEHDTRRSLAVVGLAQCVHDPRVEFRLKVAHFARAIEGLVVAEETDHRVRLQMREPLIRRGVKALAVVDRLVRMKFLRAGKCPLRCTRRMRTEARCVADVAHVAEEEVAVGVTKLQLRLDAAVPGVTLGEAIAHQHDVLAIHRWCDVLIASRRGSRRLCAGLMRSRCGLLFLLPILFTVAFLGGLLLGFVLRKAHGWAATRCKVTGLQIALLVVVAFDCGVKSRVKRIDEGHICLGRHFKSEQMMRRVHDKATQVFIRKID